MEGDPIIGVDCLIKVGALNIFCYWVINFLVNMESIQDNHDRLVFELSLVTFSFRLLSAITLFKFWVAA